MIMREENNMNPRLLLVDDEESILEMLKILFVKNGQEVTTANDYESAITSLNKESFDLIITDIVLGDKTGIDILEKVKEKGIHAPVIMITGKPTIETAATSVRLGAFDYLTKPVKTKELLILSEKALRHKSLIDKKEQLEKENAEYRLHLEDLVKKRTRELEMANERLKRENQERTKAEEELRRYEKIVSTTRDDMAFIGKHYEHLAVNESYLHSHSKNREEMMHLRIQDILDPFVFEKYVQPRLDKCLSGHEIHYEGWFAFEGAGKQYRAVSYYPYFEPDQSVSGVVLNSRDITEQKQAEEAVKMREHQLIQADRLSSLAVLVSGVASEINAPTTSISVIADSLLEFWKEAEPALDEYQSVKKRGKSAIPDAGRLKNEVPVLIRELAENSAAIKRILSQLKDFAVTDVSESMKPVDLNGVLRSSISLIQSKINDTTDNFSVSYFPDLLTVKCISQKLEQVFINILLNACESLTDPAQNIVILVKREDADEQILLSPESGAGKKTRLADKYAVVEISDQGMGMDEDTMNHVFDPFFTTKREKGNVGLGLSVSHTIIENHNGFIRFASQEGKGTTCRILLPLY